MYKNLVFILISVMLIITYLIFSYDGDDTNLKLEALRQEYSLKPSKSVDHSKFEVLQKEFKTPQEVTEACISCHNERHTEVMQSSHWNWSRVSYVEGEGLQELGKKNLLNNFCIGAQSNEQACAKCHIGFGMTDDEFSYENAKYVDCMVCHDNSQEYIKGASMAGHPDRSVNLNNVAQSVGAPTKNNCGACHFYSGGGNNVKHGDLEEAMLSCSREVDVHMASNGMNMECVACHTAENHKIKGKLYSVSSENTNRATCQDCHTANPHFDDLLNRHNDKVSCQTCHIPYYAKENATKMTWKWSDAGKLKDGEAFHEDDSLGNHTYMSIKGSFTWAKNVEPEYIWFNGTAKHYHLGDKVDTIPVQINTLNGSYNDAESKIIPVKVHRGDQIMDKKFKNLIQPKVYAAHEGDSAFWKDFDWNTAAAAGMKNIGMPYSGEYSFVETEMYWPVNHQVSPASEALSCAECHTRENGRLAGLNGFYLPGRDTIKWIDQIGITLLVLSIIGVLIHTVARIVTAFRNKEVKMNVIDYKE